MSWLYDIVEELWAIASLVIPALESLMELNPKNFWSWIAGAVCFAFFMYGLARFFGRMWFKKYELSMAQSFFWVFALFLSGAGVMLFVVGKNLGHGLDLLLFVWQGQINADKRWGDETYKACYEAVKTLDLEDFSDSPPPGQGMKTFIPLNFPESRLAHTRVMMDRAAIHFATTYPALGRLLKVTDGLDTPTSELKEKIDEFFNKVEPDAEGNKHLPRDINVDMCADILRETFNTRVGALERLTYVVATLAPLASWVFLFIWVGRKANTDIENKIVRANSRK